MKNRKAVLHRALTGLAVLCLVAVLLFGTASPALPAVTGQMILKVDNEQILSLLKKGEKIPLSLYKLSGRTGDYLNPEWTYVDPFDFASLADRISAYEEKVRTDKYPDDDTLLKEIEKLIKDKGVKSVASGNFSKEGVVTFNDRDEGLYFFMMTDGPFRVHIKSAIVPVPFVYKTAMYYSPIELTVKGSVTPTPPTPPPSPTPTTTPIPRPTPTPYIPPYIPPVNPNPPINPPVNPPQQNQNEIIIDDYDTPLGIAVEFNHVGDCYE